LSDLYIILLACCVSCMCVSEKQKYQLISSLITLKFGAAERVKCFVAAKVHTFAAVRQNIKCK